MPEVYRLHGYRARVTIAARRSGANLFALQLRAEHLASKRTPYRVSWKRLLGMPQITSWGRSTAEAHLAEESGWEEAAR